MFRVSICSSLMLKWTILDLKSVQTWNFTRVKFLNTVVTIAICLTWHRLWITCILHWRHCWIEILIRIMQNLTSQFRAGLTHFSAFEWYLWLCFSLTSMCISDSSHTPHMHFAVDFVYISPTAISWVWYSKLAIQKFYSSSYFSVYSTSLQCCRSINRDWIALFLFWGGENLHPRLYHTWRSWEAILMNAKFQFWAETLHNVQAMFWWEHMSPMCTVNDSDHAQVQFLWNCSAFQQDFYQHQTSLGQWALVR
jgi:hypothetical protein